MAFSSSSDGLQSVSQLFVGSAIKDVTSRSSSRIYYFDREGPTDVAVLLQGTLRALSGAPTVVFPLLFSSLFL